MRTHKKAEIPVVYTPPEEQDQPVVTKAAVPVAKRMFPG